MWKIEEFKKGGLYCRGPSETVRLFCLKFSIQKTEFGVRKWALTIGIAELRKRGVGPIQ